MNEPRIRRRGNSGARAAIRAGAGCILALSFPAAGAVPNNADAAQLHKVDSLRDNVPLGKPDGSGVVVGVFESEGGPYTAHPAFQQRVTQRDNWVEPNHHGTHVAGTVGAAPAGMQAAEGMAPGVTIHSYEINEDYWQEMAAVDPLMSVSVHSYNARAGWTLDEKGKSCADAEGEPPLRTGRPCWAWEGRPRQVEDELFGAYTDDSRRMDQIAFDQPHRTMVVSAGNDRDDNPGGPNWDDWHLHRGVWTKGVHKSDSTKGGFDTIGGSESSAKNVITVGSLDDAPPPIDRTNLRISDFSGFGPTNDGRVKPDVVANGRELLSLSMEQTPQGIVTPTFDRDWGTSMAAPVVAGIAALLNEVSQKTRQRPLFSDEMKAVLVHTAVNTRPGPSFRTGWGAVDALAAGKVAGGQPEAPLLMRQRLPGGSSDLRLRARAGTEVKVTLVWIDTPGRPVAGLNPPDQMLVDDLDLLLLDPRGRRHFPWSADRTPTGEKVEGCFEPTGSGRPCPANRKDNVEQVQVPPNQVRDGVWTVRVSRYRGAADKPYALVLSGLEPVR